MKRRAKGTGTIVKVGDVYYGRINVKGKIKKVKLSKNQRESESLWKDWVRQNINTFKTEAIKHDISEVWPSMEMHYLGQGKQRKTIDESKAKYTTFIDFLKQKGINSVEDITKRDILLFFEERCEGLSDRTKRGYKYFIHDMFKVICPNEKNPTDDLKIRRTNSLAREPFTDEELKTILEVAETRGHLWKVLIEVGLYTGLRLKDCVYLHTDSIKNDVIMVTPFKTKGHGTIVRIPLHPTLKSELASLGVSKGYYFNDLIFLYEKNRMEMRLRHIFNHIKTDLKKSVEGRKRKVTVKGFHALRATFITRLAERGVSLPIMESLAGHINPQQTMHYTHPDEDVKTTAINVLPIFGSTKTEDSKVFIHPDVQRVIDACKKQIAETIESTMGKKVEVKISASQILGGEDWFFNEL